MDLTWMLVSLVAIALRVYRDDDENTPTEKPVRSYVGSVVLLLFGFLILLLIVIALAGCQPATRPGASPPPASPGRDFEHPALSEDDVRFLHELLEAHNSMRAEKGLNRLLLRARLVSAAQLQAKYVWESGKATHSNINPELSTVADRARYVGYAWSSLGENAAYGQTTTTMTMQSWTESALHLANILGPFDDVGFAVVGDGHRYGWIAVYGRSATHTTAENKQTQFLSQPEFTEKE